MDLTWTDAERAFRDEARAWLTEHLAAWRDAHGGEDNIASGDTRAGFAQHLDWERDLYAGRWAAVSWPEQLGGRGASLWEWLIFEEEYYRAGCPPRITQNGIFLLAPTVFEFGTAAQQAHILPRMAAAEDLWCQGWSVAMATTGSERGLTLRAPGRFLATAGRLIELYRRDPVPRLRERLVEAWMRAEAYRLFTLDTVTRLAGGASMGADSSINKLWWSELDVELHEIALDLLGPGSEVEGPWSKGWQFSLAGPIYAGTNEIQRNIAAERMLGLPRM